MGSITAGDPSIRDSWTAIRMALVTHAIAHQRTRQSAQDRAKCPCSTWGAPRNWPGAPFPRLPVTICTAVWWAPPNRVTTRIHVWQPTARIHSSATLPAHPQRRPITIWSREETASVREQPALTVREPRGPSHRPVSDEKPATTCYKNVMPLRLYRDDSYLTRFSAKVEASRPEPDGL